MTRKLPNFDGEKETLWTGKSIVHRFIEAANLSWHYLETGNPGKPAVVFLHGMPECAFAWHHQITALSDSFHCITLDLKGYGQSDTTLDTDYDYAAQAAELVSVFDVLGLQNFSLVTHDRGSVIADHLCAVPGMNQRIQRYIRMQQSGNRPHSEPRPPHKMFHSQQGIDLLKSGALPYGPRPAEELYDLESDPHELVNLAEDPAYRKQLDEMSGALAGWLADTGDKGQYPLSAAAMREITERFPKDWLRNPEFQSARKHEVEK